MKEIKDKYICGCCGGRINRVTMTCEYCGTQYKEDRGDFVRIETFRNPVKTLAARVIFPREDMAHLGESIISEIAVSRIQQQIAEALTDVMKYDVEFDHSKASYIVRGEVRAVIPQDKGIEGNKLRGLKV